ncbi:hypothetical protein [Coralloluteibacterium stylophorae]|uniref:Uncharacterized protein n=1 Tax=Coralloluteibacterium stylophorae TaxID=1776034 RepID=A0AAP2CEK4_9GAMM|nr:hypothetical protein [Coralloluteibacterium stylophorae]MBS7458915.1 hypothetical protein [Coralloluteibacterium stylophorae]
MNGVPPPWLAREVGAALARAAPCIACGACDREAPPGLSPQRMHRLVLDGRLPEAEALGLAQWRPMPACDAVCPSRIPLSGVLEDARREQARRQEARARFEARRIRLARIAAEEAERRRAAQARAGGDAVAAAIARARARRDA